MKKLMTVLASAALAFGLYADDAVLKDGTSFESGEDGVSEGVFAPEATSVWDISGLSDPLEIGEYADGEELPYETSGTNVRWDDKFKQYTDNFSYLTLDTGTEKLTRAMGTGNVVIDQIVKFSGFDEVQTNFVEGATKIAVWMSDIEKDGEANETNLYVTCGKLADGKVEPVAIKIVGDWELQKWYRLTIKSIGNIWPTTYADDERAGFVVYIDGNKVASDDAKTIVEDYSNLNGAAGKLYAQGQLFPAIDNTDTTFTSVSYAGTGAIDDIVADSKGPAFAIDTVAVTIPAVPNATVTGVAGADSFDPKTGIALVNPNTTITITWEPESGYRLSKTSKEVEVGDEAMTVNVNDVVANFIIATVWWNEYVDSCECTNVIEALTKVQELEALGIKPIYITTTADIPETVVPDFGTLAIGNGGFITIAPGTWTFSGAAATLKTDIAAEATVTADATVTFTFAGEVAGTLQADVFGANSAIALAVGGQVIAKADNLEIGVPSGYTLKKTAGTEKLEGYTIYTAELPPAPTYTVTFSTNKVTVAEKTLTEVAEGTELKSEQIPDFGEGTWDVEPLGAIITCDTNFNFTVKAEENWDVPSGSEDKPASEVWTKVPENLADVPAGKLSKWAKDNEVPFGGVFTETMSDAYLLDCAPTAEKVAEEKAKINIASIEFVDGEWVITTVSGKIETEEFGNGKLQLVDVTEAITGAEGSDATKLWKMKLVPITAK